MSAQGNRATRSLSGRASATMAAAIVATALLGLAPVLSGTAAASPVAAPTASTSGTASGSPVGTPTGSPPGSPTGTPTASPTGTPTPGGPAPTTTGPAGTPVTTTTTPPGENDPGTQDYGVFFSDGAVHGFTGSPASVSVASKALANGVTALSVSGLTAYGQGVQVVVPSGTAGYQYTVTASVTLLSGAAQDMRIAVEGGIGTPAMVTDRVTTAGWTQLRTGFSWSGTTPLTIRIEAVRVCSDAPAVPLPFAVLQVATRYYSFGPGPWASRTPQCPLSAVPYPTSPPASPTPELPLCYTRYTVVSAWPGGFSATLRVRLRQYVATYNWRLDWALPAGQRIVSAWPSGGVTTTGSRVSIAAPPSAPDIPSGGSVTVHLLGTRRGAGPVAVPAPISLGYGGPVCAPDTGA